MNEYAKELGEVLQTFDIKLFRQFILDHIELYSTNVGNSLLLMCDDRFAKGMMAKMILARTDMPIRLKQQAKQILNDMEWDYGIY